MGKVKGKEKESPCRTARSGERSPPPLSQRETCAQLSLMKRKKNEKSNHLHVDTGIIRHRARTLGLSLLTRLAAFFFLAQREGDAEDQFFFALFAPLALERGILSVLARDLITCD